MATWGKDAHQAVSFSPRRNNSFHCIGLRMPAAKSTMAKSPKKRAARPSRRQVGDE
jgi:hypothetical protein